MNYACSTCLGSFTPISDVSSTPCGHVFHTECIEKWLNNGSNNCSQCRRNFQRREIIKLYFSTSQSENNLILELEEAKNEAEERSLKFQKQNSDLRKENLDVYKENSDLRKENFDVHKDNSDLREENLKLSRQDFDQFKFWSVENHYNPINTYYGEDLRTVALQDLDFKA